MKKYRSGPRLLLLLAGSCLSLATVTAQTYSAKELEAAARVQDLHPVLDNHLDIPFEFGKGDLDAGKDGPSAFDFVKAERGHLKGAVVAIFVPQNARTPEGYREAAEKADIKLAAIRSTVAEHPQRAAIAHSPAELLSIEASGKFAIILSILNGNVIGKDLSLLDAWREKGVQVFGFVHSGHNDLADSSRPNLLRGAKLAEHGGLSELGKEAVHRLNDLGIVIDVSQLSGQALGQVLELTRAPVIASHSNARAIIDHPRNLSDEQLSAISANGGLVAINAFSLWVRPLPTEAIAKLNAIRSRHGVPGEKLPAGSQPVSAADKAPILPPDEYAVYDKEHHEVTNDVRYRATLTQYVDQIDYAVKKIGIDHVGISSDFNHGGGVIGWRDVGETLNVTAELQRRGYSEADIAKLWGGNFLRVWGQAQSLAKSNKDASK